MSSDLRDVDKRCRLEHILELELRNKVRNFPKFISPRTPNTYFNVRGVDTQELGY
jgi:hypothetical protein